MKTSFKKTTATATTAVPETPEPNTDTTVATRPSGGPLSAPVTHAGRDDMGGEWLASDSRLPRLNIRQKSSEGELQDNFEFGDLVFARKIKIADAETPVIVTPIRSLKDYQQKVTFGEGQGVVYRTAQEVLDNGGTLNWSREAVQDQIFFQPRAHIQFAIQAPESLTEDDLNYFPFTAPEGDRYAMSIMTVASSAYTSLGKELETLRRNNLIMLKGLIFGSLEMTTKKKMKPQQEWFIPQIKLIGENSPGLIEFLDAIK